MSGGLKSYSASCQQIGAEIPQVAERSNRVENSYQPFRRREQAMLRFRRMRSLQTIAAVHSPVFNYFNSDRSLTSQDTYKQARAAALDEWSALCADRRSAH